MSSPFVHLLKSEAKRTLTDLLKQLPNQGVGSIVTRDTWHPKGGKFWEITEVRTKKDDPTKLNAIGYKYYKGARENDKPKRIASVWKYGWMLKYEPGMSPAAQEQGQQKQQQQQQN